MQRVLILGSGLGGFSVARELRKISPDASLRMITSDAGQYYSKPMLSNAFAAGKTPDTLVISSAETMAYQLQMDLIAHNEATAIDLAAREIRCEERCEPFDKLVLALGADPIAPPLMGNAVHELLHVNSLADYARFRSRLNGSRHVAILGAGLVGCEFANDLASAGFSVTVIDLTSLPLARFCPEECGVVVKESLSAIGVQWRLESRAVDLGREKDCLRLQFEKGEALTCGVVLAATGLAPRVALASSAGLSIGRGILADDYLMTSAPDVYAIGDCAEVQGRLQPFVMPIMVGARTLAATLVGAPTPVRYPPMPVAVKTPACPMVLLPPATGVAGVWDVTGDTSSRRAIYRDAAGAMRGFALIGAAVSERAALLREITV